MYVTQDRVHEPLYVITPIFNPWRYKSRWKHYERFQKRMLDAGATLLTIEAALGERDDAIDHMAPHATLTHAPVLDDTFGEAKCRHDDPKRGLHRYIRLRTNNVFWMKENMIEIARRHAPKDAKYVAWIDHDWEFAARQLGRRDDPAAPALRLPPDVLALRGLGPEQRGDHAPEGVVRLVLPPGSPAARPTLVLRAERSAARQADRGVDARAARGPRAWTRMEWVGGIMDFNIVGGGDNHMAFALIGQIERFFYPGMTAGL
jgi:hypothetical protein